MACKSSAFFGVSAGIALMLAISIAHPSPQDLEPGVNQEMSCRNQKALEERNKEVVVAAYQAIFGDYNFDAIDTLFRTDYIQHSPNMADGPESLKEFARAWTSGQEKKRVDIRKIAAEGDLVWLHVKNSGKDGKDLAFMDIFRVHDGLIAEHWNVVQPVPELSQSKNPHPLF